jgi:hypothetical protein
LRSRRAIEKVKQIVNQPVTPLPRDPAARVALYSPGWFHEGALRPAFASVDVRKTQQLPYERHRYVTSDLNPGVMFRGRDLEFNPMTKYYYVDRSLPKKRLTEEEMLEVNRLYRIIARGEPRPTPPGRATPAAGTAPAGRAASRGYLWASGLALAVGLWLYRRRSGAAR